MSWFNGLAPRERLISPVFSAIEKSERNLAAAKRDYMIVSAGLPQMKQQNSRGSQAAFNRNAVIETARRDDGTVAAQFTFEPR